MKEYKQELFAQKTPYLQWLKAQENEPEIQYGKQMHTLPFSSCMDSMQGYKKICPDQIYLFVKSGGRLSDHAMAVFGEAFLDDAGAVFAYADEDYRGSLEELYDIEDGMFDEEVTMPYRFGDDHASLQSQVYYRGKPWFKPDFSPDTLASFFYVGSVFAVRGSRMLEITGRYGSDISIYEFVCRIFMEALNDKKWMGAEKIVHIPKVLYTNDSLDDAQRMDSSEGIRALYDTGCVTQNENTCPYKVSIVIPSKDNAGILKKCLETLTQYTDYSSYEIIIVDNGSNAEQKMHIMNVINELKENKKDLVIQYLYQKMEFNFSAMCNAGARSADGEYLVFLNDDIEVMDTAPGRQWLDKMMVCAQRSHVGAVGAKLYYPPRPEENSCYRIQHAGITNMGIGPAHKLGGMQDAGCMYHGRNTHNYDMLAVTAACMLIRKSVFDEAGGFDETFPVAYNDVELCFRLYRRGYFNVQVNEAVLIHHESLSRGQDTSPEKQQRLAGEKEKLYQKHELLRARDPFYSPNLVQWKKDAAYNTGYLYDYDRPAKPVLLGNSGKAGKRKQAVFKKYDIRNLLHVKWKLAAKIYDRLTGYHDVMFQIDRICYGDGITDDKITDNKITVEGWYAVKNTDNAELPRKLWLICETRNFDFRNVYEFDIAPKLREDVAGLLEGRDSQKETADTKNTSLSGIQVNIEKGALKPGAYSIGVFGRNLLVCDMEKRVRIVDTKD